MPRVWLICLVLSLAACAPVPATPTPATAAATPAAMDCIGLHFVPVATTGPLAAGAISSEEAVSAAWQYEPGLKSATVKDLALGRLGNPADGGVTVTALAGDPLVWLVSFAGVQSVSSGPPGAAHHTSNTYAVVIDANQGQALVAFPLCDGSP